MIQLKDYLKKAHEKKFAIPQFNVSVLEEIKAAALAAQECKAPVIIGLSEGERKFINPKVAVAAVKEWQKIVGVPLFVNADHTHTISLIGEALAAGFSAVHFDGSALAYKDNVKQTKAAVAMARHQDKNVSVEGELGYLRGGSALHGKVEIKPEDLTNPQQAADFVKQTEIDILAVAVGSVHGLDVQTGQKDKLDIELISAIAKATGKPLVLHGASDVDDKQMQAAISAGICKVNINTALRQAYISTIHKVFHETDEITIYKVLEPVVEALKKIMVEKIKLFGAENKI